MKTKVFNVEINGFSNVFSNLAEVRSYVHGLKAQGYIKSGDNAVIYPGLAIERDNETTYCYADGFRVVPVA